MVAQSMLDTMPLEDRLAGIALKDRLAGIALKDRLAGIALKDRLAGLTCLTPDELTKLLLSRLPEEKRTIIERALQEDESTPNAA